MRMNKAQSAISKAKQVEWRVRMRQACKRIVEDKEDLQKILEALNLKQGSFVQMATRRYMEKT